MKKYMFYFLTIVFFPLRVQADPTPVPAPAMPGKNVPSIKVDTVGYPNQWSKIAVFNRNPKNAVIKNEKGQIVYKVKAKDVNRFGLDLASKDQVWQVDFSGLTLSGHYYFQCKRDKSDLFLIGADVYKEALMLSLKMFYFERCRTALTAPYAEWKGTSYLRPGPCHAYEDVGWDMSTYPVKKHRFVMDAGWHDAGNTDMYICSTAPTCMALLLAYERHPDLFKTMNTNIPESGNGTPDILNECRWGLRWVLCMQDKSGGFRARDSAYDFSPMGPADQDKKVRWVAGIGTASTAKACAALALAARVYEPFDKVFAAKCSDAALKGWAFLQKHPEHMVVDGHKSGEPLWDDAAGIPEEAGSRLAASVEMWRTFGKENYLKAAQTYLTQPQTQPDQFLRSAWVNISRWPVMELAEDANTPAGIKADCVDRIKRAAEEALAVVKSDGYYCTRGIDSYVWSCNMVTMEEALLLAEYAKLDPTQVEAKEAARDQWHWILGRNPNGYSMITGVGKEPTALYHCEWGLYPVLPPGYMEGGPNSYQAHFLAPDAPAKCLLWDNPKALSSGVPAHHLWHNQQKDLWDGGFVAQGKWNVGWYVVTEPDINENADLVLAAAEFQE